MTDARTRALLAEARAYVIREATSPTINLLDPPRSRANAALLRRLDASLRVKKYRRTQENP